jgi:hypothetical protein
MPCACIPRLIQGCTPEEPSPARFMPTSDRREMGTRPLWWVNGGLRILLRHRHVTPADEPRIGDGVIGVRNGRRVVTAVRAPV